MSDLKLDSLRIRNFRTFKDLTVDRLGSVNLIVGKNNVGKTSILEGIWLWNHPEFWQDLAKSLERRFPEGEGTPLSVVVGQRYRILQDYFYGRPNLSDAGDVRIRIGPVEGSGSPMEVSFEKTKRSKFITEIDTPPPYLKVVSGPWADGIDDGSAVSISNPDKSDLQYSVYSRNVNFIASDGVNMQEIGRFWDQAVRTNQKKSILNILSILLPDIEDLNWIGEPSIDTSFSGDTARFSSPAEERVPMFSFPGDKEAIPLPSLGEGVSRALWIGSSLVNSRSGILLIDEIENGLHYSVQSDLWKMIFKTAQELNVQVFATTHSYDCVQAFEQVAQDYEPSQSMLVSLRRREEDPEDIVAVLSDRDELGTVVEENIEVR